MTTPSEEDRNMTATIFFGDCAIIFALVAIAAGYQAGRQDAAQEVLDAFHMPSSSGVNMAVPGDLFERIDKIGGIERPRVKIKPRDVGERP